MITAFECSEPLSNEQQMPMSHHRFECRQLRVLFEKRRQNDLQCSLEDPLAGQRNYMTFFCTMKIESYQAIENRSEPKEALKKPGAKEF
jgi:hypothetical protein